MIGEAPEQKTMPLIPKTEYRKIVNDAITVLLGCGNNIGAIKQAVDKLYRFSGV